MTARRPLVRKDGRTLELPITDSLDGLGPDAIEFVIDGGGSEIETGIKGYLVVPYDCTITKTTLLADQVGSIVVDVYKCAYGDFNPDNDTDSVPSAADKITASAPPTITAAAKAQDSVLTGWSKSFSSGDIVAFDVTSVDTIQRVTIALEVIR